MFCSSSSFYLLNDAPEYIFLATVINTGLVWNKKKPLQKGLVNIRPLNTVDIITFDRDSQQSRLVFQEPSSEFNLPCQLQQNE